jgi:hypothetical protein
MDAMRHVMSIALLLLIAAPQLGTAEVERVGTQTYTYNTTGAWEAGPSIQQAPDGGFIAATERTWSDSSDVLLVKTDGHGDISWSKSHLRTVPGPFGSLWTVQDVSVQPLRDGGFVLSGARHYAGPDGFIRGLLMRLDAAGDSVGISITEGGVTCTQQTTDPAFGDQPSDTGD